ncbi:MAG: hypothetical protein WA775_09555 [Psychroserpens sp.]|uniref:hypothetical protein n=1 Tax=Psychroserpens sp. TaxID=2020870 RepID=UPI003C762292
MSENSSKNDTPEEVDLGQLFNAVGKMFERFFRFIGSIFIAIFSVFVFALKAVIVHVKIIASVLLIAFLIGFAYEKTKDPVYFGRMLVEPYFQSQYQLSNNIDYYNSLIGNESHEILASVFDISTEDAEKLINFNLETGPETENDLLREYDKYVSSIDTTTASQINFKDYKQNRKLFDSKIFAVEVKSRKQDIFRDLNQGFYESFKNDYSIILKNRRDSTIALKRRTFKRSVKQLDSMKLVYLKIKEEEAKNGSGKLGVQGMIPITQEKSDTKEYELLQTELRLRDSIRFIEQEVIDKNMYYDVVSKFPEIGKKHKTFFSKYSLLFPTIAFIILCVIFIGLKSITYIQNYEK